MPLVPTAPIRHLLPSPALKTPIRTGKWSSLHVQIAHFIQRTQKAAALQPSESGSQRAFQIVPPRSHREPPPSAAVPSEKENATEARVPPYAHSRSFTSMLNSPERAALHSGHSAQPAAHDLYSARELLAARQQQPPHHPPSHHPSLNDYKRLLPHDRASSHLRSSADLP